MSTEDASLHHTAGNSAHVIGVGRVQGPLHLGTGNINIDQINYNLEKYDVEPGQKHTGNINREGIRDLQDSKRPIYIGKGTSQIPTTIEGSVAGYYIKTEDNILVYGSICGLRNVELGKWNYIQDNLIGDEIKTAQGLYVHGNILARNLTLQSNTNVTGHILCENILDSSGHPAQILPTMKVNGTLVCKQSIEISENCQIGAIICAGDVRLPSHCNIKAIVARGTVYVSAQNYVPHIQCESLITDKEVKISLACVDECCDLGENTDIGFLYCENGITSIGESVHLWNSSLVSRNRQPSIKNYFWLNKLKCSTHNALGLMANGQVTSTSQLNTGTVFTSLLNEKLLLTINSLTSTNLHI